MKNNFPKALRLTLAWEGGYADDKDDPGGKTNMGITIGTLSDWLGRPATERDVRNLSVGTRDAIYKVKYWDAIGADHLPSGVDYALFDYAVNSGVGRVQKVRAALLAGRQMGEVEPKAFIDAVCNERMAFLRRLKHWSKFGRGWTNRVSGVRREAKLMADQKVVPIPVQKKVPVAPGKGKVPAPKPAAIEIVAGGAAAVVATVTFWDYIAANPIVVGLIVFAMVAAGYGLYTYLKSRARKKQLKVEPVFPPASKPGMSQPILNMREE